MAVEGLLAETSLINNFRFRQVEKQPFQGSQGADNNPKGVQKSAQVSTTNQDVKCDDSIVSDIVKARQIIQLSLASSGDGVARASEERVQKLETRVAELEETIKNLTNLVNSLTLTRKSSSQPAPAPTKKAPAPASASKPQVKPAPADDDDDVDLFGSDDDNDEADALRQKRLDEYAQKKAKKPGPIAKSSVILDVKPWDDETDMEEIQRLVRTIEMDGLVWGASKLVPLAFGIKKLQIVCVIEDEKVSIDELSEKIEGFEDLVQSVDIAAFNKI